MLDALGFSFRYYGTNNLAASVKNLNKICKIEKSPIYDSIKKIKFIVACDVANPLIGPNGATQTFGKQKGASDKELRELEENVIHFSKIVIKELQKRDQRDMERSTAPLKIAKDAIVIDTTDLKIEEVNSIVQMEIEKVIK